MQQRKTNVEDLKILHEIIAALDAIGSQLSAADHIRDYDPWEKITGLEIEIKHQISLLSAQFSERHADLLMLLASPAGLHLVWGDLKDEIDHLIK
ncbi:MAG: hypothetical protein E4H27_00205 [Anaerolineales bacterium]|nr:MAG: hypothetical protein E4H27_00205 [Anaerolineales bacterium]